MSIASRLGLLLAAFAGLGLTGAMAQGEKLGAPREVPEPGTATVRVHLPDGSGRAWFHNESALGREISFRARDLEANKSYTEKVIGVWRLPSGLLVAQERVVTFKSGQTVEANFRVPGPAAKPIEAPPPVAAPPSAKEVQTAPKDAGKKTEGTIPEKKEGTEDTKKPDAKKIEK